MPSLLQLVHKVDSFEPSNEIYNFISHDGVEIGYILPMVARQFEGHPEVVTVNHDKKIVKIKEALSTFETRNELFRKVLSQWRDEDKFKTLRGWRNELYTIYNPTHNAYMLIERAFSSLLGVITYGVHINGFLPASESEDGELKLWIPRRSYDKPTCPGQLDNTVAGGLGYPYQPYETCIKECSEEAGLDESFTRKNLKSCGIMTYIYQKTNDLNSEDAFIQPEAEFIYDLTFDKTTIPKPVDGEVHEFYLLSVLEVLQKLENGEFKYNCAGVTIDFLIRHGYLDLDTKAEITSRLHRELRFPSI